MPNIISFVIVSEVKSASQSCTEAIFVGRLRNEDTEIHVWSQVEAFNQYRWIKGPIAHLPHK